MTVTVDPPRGVAEPAIALAERICKDCQLTKLASDNKTDLCGACTRKVEDAELNAALVEERGVQRLDPTKSEPSRRTTKIVDDWIRQRLADETEVSLPDLADEAVARFIDDRVFLRSFLQDMLRPMAYQRAVQVTKQTRGLRQIGDTVFDLTSVDGKVKAQASKFLNWVENVQNGRSVRLLDMTAADLKMAAAARRKRAETELHLADLWETLASKLEPGQKVKDVFTADEIEQVRQTLSTRPAGY